MTHLLRMIINRYGGVFIVIVFSAETVLIRINDRVQKWSRESKTDALRNAPPNWEMQMKRWVLVLIAVSTGAAVGLFLAWTVAA